MAHQPVNAEVGVRSKGKIYVGIEARERLGVGYNDRVRVTFPRSEREDIAVTGCIDSSGHIQCGVSVYRMLGGERQSSEPCDSIIKEGIVESVSRTWDEEHGLSETRFEEHKRLACK